MAAMSESTRCVVLLSGGLDSATVLAVAVRERGLRAGCLTFDYGQRHAHELSCAERIADALGAESWRTVRLDPSIVASGEDRATYDACAERRVKHLYANGMI